MSREAYTPPDLTNNTETALITTTTNHTSSNTTTNDGPTSSSTAAPDHPIDLSRDDRSGRRPLAGQTYDASQLRYNHTGSTREEDFKRSQWECIFCETRHRFGPTDYLRCRECGESAAFWKVKDYMKKIEYRMFEAR